MRHPRPLIALAACAASLSLHAGAADACGDYLPGHPEPSRTVDLAICLDTSGSMNGLIDAAKTKLWAIVNDLAQARPTPKLRVALLTFGNDGHDAAAGWVRRQTDLTDDLDLVSERLFGLTTNGGTELVGRVLRASVDDLAWSTHADALKIVIVAGNESADQDAEVPFRDVCRRAIGAGIMVNSIYCGNAADEIAPAWREVAALADGHFASIDKDQGTVVIATPYDAELAKLSGSINATYLPFGVRGREAGENQARQDANAEGLGAPAAAARGQTKAGRLYSAGSWDLVDASEQEEFDLDKVKDEDLPEEMREMTAEQRAKHLEGKKAERARIRAAIEVLGKKRQAFVDAEMKRPAHGEGERSFDFAVRKAVRAQAESKGFAFPE